LISTEQNFFQYKMKQIILNLLLTLLILCTNAILEDLSSDNYEESNSMEELTTVSVFNEQQAIEINLPIQTTSVVEMISQSVRSELKKKVKHYEPTDSSEERYEPMKKLEETPEKKLPRYLPMEAKNDSEFEDTTTPQLDIDDENNETNIDIGEEETTSLPLISTSKRPPKNIEIFKTRPNELLRYYVEDGHLRSPIAALVDKKSNPLLKAKKLWKAALRPNSLLDIMVVSYDSEGIKSTYNLTNTKAMMSTLEKVREENVTDQESKTYYSIIRTGQLIPFDSAIFLSTDNLPNDTEHQVQASLFLLKKRIRVRIKICYSFILIFINLLSSHSSI
jgi:hypothetical protein